MVTITGWKKDGKNVILGEGKSAVRAVICVKADGKEMTDWTLKEDGFKADFAARESARRLAIVLPNPVKSASVKITYAPVEK